ncbi:acetyltransferase [Penicillium angulare]|uniref:acetyltransferase n=1 Tax=Penicillium angulare TaxID=116970 RepID=UPI002540E533|nr:acetyltransferase [Penicillium angulare]KAJ5267500.1 acetyltransferase [Penicillium angulare]
MRYNSPTTHGTSYGLQNWQPSSEQPIFRDMNSVGGKTRPSNIKQTTTGDDGKNRQMNDPNIEANVSLNQLYCDMSSAIVNQPPTEDLQLIPQPVLLPKPRKKRAPHRRTKTGCSTCRRRKKKCDEHKPSCSACVRGGYRCEGYQTPRNVRLPIAPVMPRPSRPFERDTSVKSRDQDIAADHTASSHQNPLSMHAISPPSHPTLQDWTIPSIHELLQDTRVGNELPPISN